MNKMMNQTIREIDTIEEIEKVLEPIIDEEIKIIQVLKIHFTKEHCRFLAKLLTEED